MSVKKMSSGSDNLPADLRVEYPFASHYLQLPAGRLHYVDEGQGMPVVMVHGNPTWSFMYRCLIKQLRPHARCIAVDHMGCGLSDKPADFSYRLQDHINNLVALVEALALKEFHLVVHDWGGPIGLGMAESFAERVQRIAVTNTAAFLSSEMPWQIRLARLPGLGKLLIQGGNAFARAALLMAVRRPLAAAVKAGFLYPYSHWQNRIAIYRFVQDIPRQSSHPSYATLARIEKRLSLLANKAWHFFWGRHDFVFNDRFLARWQQRFPQAATSYYANAGHYLLEDEPIRATEAITQHLLE